VWNNVPGWGAEDLAYRLANGGFKVVLCPVTNLYFDLAWNQNPEESGLDWGGFVDLRKPFQFIPFDYYRNARLDHRNNPLDPSVFVGKDRLTDYGKANVLGIQGNLWSETLGGDGRLDPMLAPKLFGLAERAWASDPDWAAELDPAKAEPLYREAWSRFVNLLGKRELPRLDREGIRYRIPTPGLKAEGGAVKVSVELPGFVLRYTTDGSEPTPSSPVVPSLRALEVPNLRTGEVPNLPGAEAGLIPFRGTVSVAAFDTTGRKGATARLTAP
jgi:hexosaminidase